jgi:hypothetical protein
MEVQGRVQNGVVVLEGGITLPEGTVVTVSYPVPSLDEPPTLRPRISLPLIRTGRPGSLRLTVERIAKILDDDGVSA